MSESMGDRIRTLRKAASWRQKDLAFFTSLSPRAISKLENNRISPQVQTVQTLATALGCTFVYLLYGRRGWWTRLRDRWPRIAPVQQPGVISERIDVPQVTYSEAVEGHDDDN